MPRLKFGVQKLVNQWVNVNKEHVVFNRESNLSNGISNCSPRSRIHTPISTKAKRKIADDDGVTVVTASTADASSSISTQSTNRSLMMQIEGNNWATHIKNESDSPIIISLEHLSFLRRIKRDSFGPYYMGKWRKTKNKEGKSFKNTNDTSSERVAIQVVTSNSNLDQWNFELNVLRALSPHPNLIQFFGYANISADEFDNSKTYGLVSQLDNRSSYLTEWLKKLASSPQCRCHNFYWDILSGILKGISHIHAHGVIHGFLKPENILLKCTKDGQVQVKITDFGLVNMVNLKPTKQLQSTGKCSCHYWNRYSAPELIRAHHDSKTFEVKSHSDVYSISMISWHIITRETPFSIQASDSEVLRNMRINTVDENGCIITPRPPFPKGIPPNLQLIFEQCWSDNPEERPSLKEINDDFLKDLRDNLLEEQELKWVNDHKGHPVYYDEQDESQPNVIEDMDDIEELEIPHRKMSELSVHDKSRKFHSEENNLDPNSPALKIFTKRNLDIDISILTKSQRKGLLRFKRPKFSMGKQKDKSPQKNSITSKENIFADNCVSSTRVKPIPDVDTIGSNICVNSIPFAPQLAPAGTHFLMNGHIHKKSSALPLFQPILPNFNNTKPLQEKQRKKEIVIPRPIEQILHFNHAKYADIEGNKQKLYTRNYTINTQDHKYSNLVPPIEENEQDEENNIILGHVLPPENHDTIFRRLETEEDETKTDDNDDENEQESERARMDAAEVLTSHFCT